jgi:ribosomal protein S18 acetylase RimI-like enzyme
MRKASKQDIKLVVDIITESFQDNPSVLSVIKNDHKQKQRISALAVYAFKTGLRRNGVLISSDEQAIAICYPQGLASEGLADLWNQLVFAIKGIGVSRVPKVMQRAAMIKKSRLQDNDYLYFWFFGVRNKGRGQGGAQELKAAIFEESTQKKLPILVETSVNKNKKVYERFGFQVYHTWENKAENLTLWFMKRPYDA